jgi:hypothetical protein
LAHFVCGLAHLPDQPILNRSPRIICDTRNHCLHFLNPNDLGEYMRGQGTRAWAWAWAAVVGVGVGVGMGMGVGVDGGSRRGRQ